MFQSRNRGSFEFKSCKPMVCSSRVRTYWFQSRNRGSFEFKWVFDFIERQIPPFQSRNRGSFEFKDNPTLYDPITGEMFQSRNRGSFDFKAL